MRHLLPLVVCIGCGRPAVEPGPDPDWAVQTKVITAKAPLPNVMLLLDRSATMSYLDEVRSATGQALRAHGQQARFGLAAFPSDAACGAGQVSVDVPGDPLAIEGQAQALTQQGNASIAASLRAIDLPDDRRDDFVLLITGSDEGCGGDPVEAARELRRKSVRTIVVPVGVSSATLDAMAVAGGFPRTCPLRTDAECGAGGCNTATNLCNQPAWNARDGAELPGVLDALLGLPVTQDNLCRFFLEPKPRSPGHLLVYVDSRQLYMGPETWTLNGDFVELLGPVCDRLKSSTTESPVTVELRVNIRP